MLKENHKPLKATDKTLQIHILSRAQGSNTSV